jgi:hypothetical protein
MRGVDQRLRHVHFSVERGAQREQAQEAPKVAVSDLHHWSQAQQYRRVGSEHCRRAGFRVSPSPFFVRDYVPRSSGGKKKLEGFFRLGNANVAPKHARYIALH